MRLIGKILLTLIFVMCLTATIEIYGFFYDKKKICKIAMAALLIEMIIAIILFIVCVWGL